MKRHLRQMYTDPIRRTDDWGLVTSSDGRVTGVYSKSEEQPIRTAAVDLGGFTLPPSNRYSDWRFVYEPPSALPAGGVR
jgi:hypothetical protein